MFLIDFFCKSFVLPLLPTYYNFVPIFVDYLLENLLHLNLDLPTYEREEEFP